MATKPPVVDPPTVDPPEPVTDPPGKIEDLPEWARKQIADANREAAKYRTKVRELEPQAAKAAELEEATKSETQRASDAKTAAEQRAQAAELELARLRVAVRKGLTETQAKRLVGATDAELEADADELLTSFTPAAGDGTGTGGGLSGKPIERLQGGGNPTEELAETDPTKLAALVPRGL